MVLRCLRLCLCLHLLRLLYSAAATAAAAAAGAAAASAATSERLSQARRQLQLDGGVGPLFGEEGGGRGGSAKSAPLFGKNV